MSKKKILFVDDDKRLLQGIRRIFMTEPDMEAVLAEGGEVGLEQLTRHKIDAVVVDMRMPGMDGATFLAHVHAKYPQIFRIVLSGHSDPAMAMRTIGTAHQFLSKPCDFKLMQLTLKKFFSLQSIVPDPDVARLISKVSTVMVLSDNMNELNSAMSCKDRHQPKAASIISRDPGLAAGLLKLVNTSFFGLPRRIHSISTALNYLGDEVLSSLTLFQNQFFNKNQTEFNQVYLKMLWEHSYNTGLLAKMISKQAKFDLSPALCFKCGLLHDIGKLLVIDNFAEQYPSIIRACQEPGVRICEAENSVLGVSHTQIGAYLLGLWGFSNATVLAIANHHCQDSDFSLTDKNLQLAAVLHSANVLEHKITIINKNYDRPAFNKQLIASSGLDMDLLKNIELQGSEILENLKKTDI